MSQPIASRGTVANRRIVAGLLKVADTDLDEIVCRGAAWMVEHGYERPDDLLVSESSGCLPGANAAAISTRARERGRAQFGTIGSGNHFLEVQVLDEVYDRATASVFGLGAPGQVVVFLHTGSRGLGHQVCQDFLDVMASAQARYGITLLDRQLACAPIRSPEGQRNLAAMATAANFAWANRQCITEIVRRAFERIFARTADDLDMRMLYDVAHNSAKIERHRFEGRELDLCVHRKGATRAFPAGHPDLPERYRATGQPVLVPGDMGRYSYVAVGQPQAMEKTWGSACHGAGRVESRHAAKRKLRGVNLVRELEARGIIVRCQNPRALTEEASLAYKDVADVVEVLERAGIARRVARMRPLGVVKG